MTNKERKKLKGLLFRYRYKHPSINKFKEISLLEHIKEQYNYIKDFINNNTLKSTNNYLTKSLIEYEVILKTISIYNATEADIEEIHKELFKEYKEREKLLKIRPIIRRDNKGVYIGNGGSNKNKIRYPKKNRSKRTWAMFYKMFPNQAIIDEWDGKTSKRMN